MMVFLLSVTLLAQAKLPPVEKTVLPNGLTVLMTQKSDLPLVSLRLLVRGGAEAEPAELAGLAALTTELMRAGTAKRTAAEIETQLGAMAASLRFDSDGQSIAVDYEFLSSDTEKALALLSEIVLTPAFPEAEVKKVLARARDGAKATKDNPQGAIGLYHRANFFGAGHPYGRPPRGDEMTLARIDRAAMVALYERLFVGKNGTLIVAGSFAPAAMKASLAKAFGGLKPGERFTGMADPGMARAKAARLLLVDKPDSTQTYFQISQPGIQRGHPDAAALRLVNTLFGGRFTSMLNDELRVNSGLTYGASSRVQEDRLTGAITIGTFTKTESTERAVDITLGLLKKLAEKGLDEAQLKSAKAYVKGTFAVERLETSDQLVETLGDIELFGLNRGEVDDYFSRIDAVTVAKANEVARKYYRGDGLVFTLLGNAAKIREAVKKYGVVTEVAITKPGYPVQ